MKTKSPPSLVQVGHVALVDGRGLDLDAGVERLVDDLAGHHVLQRGAHEGAALARLDVLELGDGPELALEVEDEAVLEVVGGGHGVSPGRAVSAVGSAVRGAGRAPA